MFKHLRISSAARAGALLLVLTVVLAGCGADVAGTWSGTWQSTDGTSGQLQMVLQQSGSDFSGAFTAVGSSCFGTANLTGSLSGDAFTASAEQSGLKLDLHGTVKNDKTIDGTFSTAAGSACAGLNGSWNVTKQ